MIKRLRGTYDVLPEEVVRWQYIENTFREILERYGYKEIRTPVFEETSLFSRSIGETTDIVEKEMYTFLDKKGRSITLRPEGTASIVRAYIEAGINPEVLAKFYYYGDMFRYDRPQKGRFREFRQIGVEAIGNSSPSLDAEVISLGIYLLESVGLKDLDLNLNSIGCSDCRRIYYDKLRNYFNFSDREKLCPTCQKRLEKNPLRIFDCKEEKCQRLLKEAPAIADFICKNCTQSFEAVKKYLAALDISFTINPRLVRGLDYYTRTAFEILFKKMDSPQQNTLLAGGRYDNLIEELGGPKCPAVGFAAGMERILLAMEISKVSLQEDKNIEIYFASLGEVAFFEAFKITNRLRKNGFYIMGAESGRSLKSQLREADRLGVRYTLILGGDELSRGVVMLRDMKESKQQEIPLKNLETELRKLQK